MLPPCIYMDHQYKGYVFNNIFWGKNNKVNDPIYNAAGIQEANGFLNYVFNNTIYNVVLGFHKSQTEHNRCYYLNNLVIDSGSMLFLHEPRNSSIEHETLAYGYNLFEGSLSASFGILGGGEVVLLAIRLNNGKIC